MLRVAIAGLKGHWGGFMQGLESMSELALVAIAEDDEGKRAEARKWGPVTPDIPFYSDWREMLAKEHIDVLCEGGVDSERASVVLECARRGIHLLAEKPLANSLPELEQEREAVEKAGIKVSMLLTMRYEAPYRAVRQAIADGAIGEVVTATAQKSYRLGNRLAWQRDQATFSGIIPFIGIHALDLIRWTTGREFVQVMACHGNIGHPAYGDLEDQGQVLALLDNGGSASARLDYCRPAKAPTDGDDRLRLAGSKGVIETGNLLDAERGGPLLLTDDAEPRILEVPAVEEGPMTDFVGWVLGGPVCAVPPEDCYRMTKVALKAREAARTGSPQRV